MIPSESQDVRYFPATRPRSQNFHNLRLTLLCDIAWSNSVCQAEQEVGGTDSRFNFPKTLLASHLKKQRWQAPLGKLAPFHDSWRSKTLKLFLYWSGWHISMLYEYLIRLGEVGPAEFHLVLWNVLLSGHRRNFLMRLPVGMDFPMLDSRPSTLFRLPTC